MENETEKINYTLWIGSFLVVCAVYVAMGLAFVFLYVPDSRAVGGAEAIMLEFAMEAQAPEVEEISENIQEETTAALEEVIEPEPEPEPEIEQEPKPESLPTPDFEPVPEPEAEIMESTPQSDMVEEIKPIEEIEKKPEPKPTPKPKPKVKKSKPKKAVKKTDKTQKAKGPDLAALKGQKFAAPQTNRNFGNQGKAKAGWKTKVQRKIALMAKRLNNTIYFKAGFTIMISFYYDARGVITRASVTRSSGNNAADALALKAVQSSSPLPAPPSGQAGSLNIPVRIGRY